ncbi:MAG TPA: hypothetical protein VK908_17305 [Jiangellales bacterium]|nr:hypothetical protein [Jiangellales bacterium]
MRVAVIGSGNVGKALATAAAQATGATAAQSRLRPLDVGPLSKAATLERMAFLHIGLNMANGWPWQSGWKVLGPTG